MYGKTRIFQSTTFKQPLQLMLSLPKILPPYDLMSAIKTGTLNRVPENKVPGIEASNVSAITL